MKEINNTQELAEKIMALEAKWKQEWPLLKEELAMATENLNPLSMIKNSIQKSVSSPIVKSKLLSGIVGLAAGYASKKLVFGATHNIVTSLAAALLETEVASAVSSKPEKIELILQMAKKLFSKNENT